MRLTQCESKTRSIKWWLLGLLSFVAVAAGTYSDFLSALAKRESSGNSHIVNAYGYAGLYQMGETALIDAGYYRRDGTTANDWQGSWTGKNGINSLNDFLNNTAVQTQAITAYHEVLWHQITARHLNNWVGQSFQGVPITPSGLIAAAHLIGAGGLRSCLNGGSCSDANSTTAQSYMGLFGGFDIGSLTGSTPMTGGNGSITTSNPMPSVASNTNSPFPMATPLSTDQAFSSGANASLTDIHDLVLGVLSISLLLWAAWLSHAQFSSWRYGKVVLMQMQSTIVSSLILLSVVLFISLT